MTASRILTLNGPGLSDLSNYDGHSYGNNLSLELIENQCEAQCQKLGISLDFRQTDDEEKMFRWISEDHENYDGLIINPVGYSRAASVEFEMYRTAIKLIAHLKKPVIEVHMSNIFKPGAEITKPLHVPDGEMGFVSGMGIHSYLIAIRSIHKRLTAA